MTKRFVIKGPVVDGEQLYWSNEGGWWDRKSATEFSDEENVNFPLESVGKEYISDIRKSVITIMVLHREDAPINEMTLGQIIEECDTGDMIAGTMYLQTDSCSLTRSALTEKLLSVGSDADFFGEDEEEIE